MTNLPTLQPSTENQRPSTLFSEPWLSNLRRGLGRIGNTPVLMSGFSISPEKHRQIEARASSLRQATTAGVNERALIGVELAKLLAAFPSQDPGMSSALRIEAYSEALSDTPAWAVREARLQLVRGTALDDDSKPFDQRWAPTPPQLATLVRGILEPLRRDLADLVRLVSIPVSLAPSADEKARVARGFDELRESFEPSKRGAEASARAALEERARGLGIDPAAIDALPDAPPRDPGMGRPAVDWASIERAHKALHGEPKAKASEAA